MANAKFGLDTALASILRRKWLAVAVFSVVLAAALSFAKALPNLYQSTATVLVERPTRSDGPDDVESRLQSIRQEILSRTRLAELIARLDIYPKLRPLVSQEALVERMRHDVRIEVSGSELAGRGTIAFSLAYRGRDPQKVTLVTNALTSSYIEEDALLRERETRGAASELEMQLEEVRGRLALQETRIAEFKKLHVGELPQQAGASLAAVERLSAQIQGLREKRAAAVERRATLRREGEAQPAAGATDPDRARLEELNQELAELRTRFSERYPDVVRKQAEADSLAALVAKKPRVDRVLPQLEQLNREIRGLEAEEQRLRGEVGAHQRRAEGAPWLEQEYQVLSRDYATTRDFYDSLLKRYEEAQLAEAHGGGPRGQRLRLLDPAIVPVEPLAPDRLRVAVFGLIASLALAFVAVAGAERLDTSFHSADELKEYTRVPLLARIPRLANLDDTDRTRARWRAGVLALAVVLGIACAVGVARMLGHDNEGIVALLAPRGRP